MTLGEIEKLTQEFQAARTILKEHVETLEAQIRAIKKHYLPAIRRAAEKAADRHRVLHEAIEGAPEVFVRPKTFIFHGIRVGYIKSRGEIVWEDTATVLKLIKKNLPDQADQLIKASETPIKTALAQLSVGDLKKIGVSVIETGDEVVIKPTDSEIDRIVNAILKEDEIKEAA